MLCLGEVGCKAVSKKCGLKIPERDLEISHDLQPFWKLWISCQLVPDDIEGCRGQASWLLERPTLPSTPLCVESFDMWSRRTPGARPLSIFTVNSPSDGSDSLYSLHKQWPPFKAIT